MNDMYGKSVWKKYHPNVTAVKKNAYEYYKDELTAIYMK